MSGALPKISYSAVELHLPSLDRDGNPIDRGPWVDRAVAVMCDAFGGTYEETVIGHWVNSTDSHMREETSRIVSYAEQDRVDRELPRLLDLAAEFMRAANQEVVLVAVDGTPHPVQARFTGPAGL